MQPTTLIQLISGQNMPNLLPVLRLRPAKLVHLVTAKTASQSAIILDAAKQAGLDPKINVVSLSAMPSIPETFQVVQKQIQAVRAACGTPVVNFTGGTKMMSIGAYAAAQTEKVDSLYVDTDDAVFVSGFTGQEMGALLGNDFSFTQLLPLLDVSTVAVANRRNAVSAGMDWQAMLPLAEALFGDIHVEQTTHDAMYGAHGLCPNGRTPQLPKDWLTSLQKTFRLPPNIATLALSASLVVDAGGGALRLPQDGIAELQRLAASTPQNPLPNFAPVLFAATASASHALGFLTGGWWEVIVAREATRAGIFRDLRWSAIVKDKSGAELEEDLLGMDGVQMMYVSCKRGGTKARLLPQLEEIQSRASGVGGIFTRRFLAVLLTPTGVFGKRLEARAKELKITLITPRNVTDPQTFIRRP
ncbi:MAG: hypothetical protein ACOYMN_05415 [Roseimicrobium sp.]